MRPGSHCCSIPLTLLNGGDGDDVCGSAAPGKMTRGRARVTTRSSVDPVATPVDGPGHNVRARLNVVVLGDLTVAMLAGDPRSAGPEKSVLKGQRRDTDVPHAHLNRRA